MFTGFNLTIDKPDFLDERFYEKGLELLTRDKLIIKKSLEDFTSKEQIISGNLLQENWFPQINANILISHSHKDEKMIIALTGWLYESFGIKSFIDSSVWGYANDLLKLIDDAYCLNLEGTNKSYNYEKRNYSTSHVHLMLSVALTKMIDATECLFFINTPKSISIAETINSGTFSPWIYLELQISEMVRHKKLKEYRKLPIEKRAQFAEAELKILYDINVDHLISINNNDLLNWQKYGSYNESYKSLDYLYEYKKLFPSKTNG